MGPFHASISGEAEAEHQPYPEVFHVRSVEPPCVICCGFAEITTDGLSEPETVTVTLAAICGTDELEFTQVTVNVVVDIIPDTIWLPLVGIV
jgi:hypothetical protein